MTKEGARALYPPRLSQLGWRGDGGDGCRRGEVPRDHQRKKRHWPLAGGRAACRRGMWRGGPYAGGEAGRGSARGERPPRRGRLRGRRGTLMTPPAGGHPGNKTQTRRWGGHTHRRAQAQADGGGPPRPRRPTRRRRPSSMRMRRRGVAATGRRVHLAVVGADEWDGRPNSAASCFMLKYFHHWKINLRHNYGVVAFIIIPGNRTSVMAVSVFKELVVPPSTIGL